MVQGESDSNSGKAAALNQALVEELKSKGLIKSPEVEGAFRAVLRHLFVPGTPLEEAYSDRAISAKEGPDGRWLSSSSQPAIMAIMLEQLALEPGQRVLEIGAGTGYNAALMAHIVGEEGQVVTIDIDEDLTDAARERLRLAGFEQVQVVRADGGYGYPEAAPFDRIILTVGALDITPAWWEQLKPGGRIVLPLILKGAMKSIAFEKLGDHLQSISVSDCGFIPLRGDFAGKILNEVQIGPSPDLYVEPGEEFPIDSEGAYQLLSEASTNWAVHVETSVWEALNGSLWTWLAFQEPHLCKLVARGDMVDRNMVPGLIGFDGPQRSCGTVAVLEKGGVATLSRTPGEALHMLSREKMNSADAPFELFVRQYGPNDAMAQRLVAEIQAWEKAGRPGFDQAEIRAYRKEAEYVGEDGEIVIEKEWTKIVVRWEVTLGSD